MVFHQRHRHRFDGGAYAHKQRSIVGNMRGHQIGQMRFFALQFVFLA